MNNEWITDRLPTQEDASKTNMSHVFGRVFVTRDNETTSCLWLNVDIGEAWQPITVPEPYVKPKRWSVHYCNHEVKWCLQDSVGKEKVYFPTMTTNDADSAVKMQRLANAYQEVLP